MRDDSGRWTLVFNGEIYNYRELRRSLEGSWKFRDASDTEVLLAGLASQGKAFIDRLDGMWAFALHDSRDGSLLMARDPFGKKPLFYRGSMRAFACASELSALRVLCPDEIWSENAAGISDYFRYGFAMPGRTCLEGVFEVLPGSWLERDGEGRMRSARYWMPTLSPWQGSFEDAASEARRLLVAGVRKRQLAADVEVGAFLSGGVDSTIICALAQQTGLGRLRTFTIGFGESSYDERQYAARAAGMLDTLHTERLLSADQALDMAAKLSSRFGQPFGDASLVPTAMVSSLAAGYVKVALSGDGGDELFGGYARYAARLLLQYYRRLPGMPRRVLESALSAMPEPLSHHSASLLKKAHLFVGLANEAPENYVAPPAMRSDALSRLAPGLPQGNPAPLSAWGETPDELGKMLVNDWLIWLPQDILAKTDRASMFSSLEVRCPFLDRDLAEFVLRLPWRWHFRGFRGKRLLHAAMRGRTPDFVWSRRKQGFASPVGHWMRSRMGDELLALSSGDTGAVDGRSVRSLLAEHRAGLKDHSQPLWLVYSYLSWRVGAA